MKTFRISILILVLLLAAGLVNGLYLTQQSVEWTAGIDTVSAAAEDGDWDRAAHAMAALEESWQRHQSYLCITLPHDEINEADTLLHQLSLAVQTGEKSDLDDTALQLRLQIDRLAEMERLSLKNVL